MQCHRYDLSKSSISKQEFDMLNSELKEIEEITVSKYVDVPSKLIVDSIVWMGGYVIDQRSHNLKQLAIIFKVVQVHLSIHFYETYTLVWTVYSAFQSI